MTNTVGARSRRAVVTGARTSLNKIDLDMPDVNRPAWSRDRLPIQVLTAVEPDAITVSVDRFVLRPSAGQGIIYVAPSEVSLVDFSLTLRRSVLPDRSLAITGGSAVFTITVDDPQGIETLALERHAWHAALKSHDVVADTWSFRPEPRRGLTVSLELPLGVAAAPPLIVAAPMAGVATVAVELTEIGALVWKAALEQGTGATVPGIFHVTTSAPAVDHFAIRLERRSLETTVGRLLAGRSAADIRYVDPQQTVRGRLIVVTSDFVEQSAVAVRPNQGEAPTGQVLGPAGGQVEVSVTTQDVGSVAMAWSAQVAFTPLGWPPIPVSGVLEAANIWTEMIKPEAWFASYLIMAVPVDGRGQAQSTASEPPADLQGALNFTAPYVANGLLNAAFRADYLHPVNVALPRYPNQPFGDLVLTMFAARNGKGGTASRRLKADELHVVVLVHPDARIEIRTSSDALAEVSTAAGILDVLASLARP
jgi:hypothetical protein